VRSLPSPLHPIKDAPDPGIPRTSPPLQSTRAAPPPLEPPPDLLLRRDSLLLKPLGEFASSLASSRTYPRAKPRPGTRL
jgi:hypothetical protein